MIKFVNIIIPIVHLKKIKRAEDNPAALYMLDEELATRVFTPPTTA